MIRVQAVAPESLGAALEIVPGTELLEVNGKGLEDFLDWEFLTADDEFVLRARLPSGEEIEYDVERPEGLPMGVMLEPPRIRRCANHCDFCFVDGNPQGMRQALYIRDDDYRLSFRYGNFATLTNLKPWDVERIVEYRLSPLYVSVHATDPVVRRWLLRNPDAPEVLSQLRWFGERGIAFHAQIVLVPGVNDGPQLVRSLGDLYAVGDPVLSVSVVPVARTEFSKHQLVREPTRDECRASLRAVGVVAARALAERGHPWCFGAAAQMARTTTSMELTDYLAWLRERPRLARPGTPFWSTVQTHIPPAAQEQLGEGEWRGKRIAVLTGTAMGPLLPQVLAPLADATGAAFELLVLENSLFGASVTTAGLLPGAAFLAALEGRNDLDLALLPAEAVNDDLRFLDDVDARDLAGHLGVPVKFSYDFADALAGQGVTA